MEISSTNVKYSDNYIDTVYDYHTTIVEKSNGKLLVRIDYWFEPQLTRNISRLMAINQVWKLVLFHQNAIVSSFSQLRIIKSLILKSFPAHFGKCSYVVPPKFPRILNLKLQLVWCDIIILNLKLQLVRKGDIFKVK